MTPSNNRHQLLLRGLDGANPLAFLAAVGTLTLIDALGENSECEVQMGWRDTAAGWRPTLRGFDGNETDLCDALERLLNKAPVTSLDIGRVVGSKKATNKFPFDAGRFRDALVDRACDQALCREADLLAGLGTELYPDSRTGAFQCTAFKMVRSGDSKGQGMLHYAKAIREKAKTHVLKRTLFEPWDYQYDGYSLRWDPIENQSYALRWRDPSKSKLADGPGSMPAANSLAFEALRCLPCAVVGTKLQTTGFQEVQRREFFIWSIWTSHLTLATVRSLLSLGELHRTPLSHRTLEARGIAEVFRAAVIRPNQYYRNFAPAQPAL